MGQLAFVLGLRHLHVTGIDCTSGEERRTPWRRWFHHATFYGFLLCFASTTVAAVYHSVFGWYAPYGYASVPVLLSRAVGDVRLQFQGFDPLQRAAELKGKASAALASYLEEDGAVSVGTHFSLGHGYRGR